MLERLKKSEYYTVNIITILLCFVPVLLGIIFYTRMPDVMPIHYDINNNPDGYAPKFVALFILPLSLAAVHVFTCLYSENDIRYKNVGKSIQILIRFLLPIISIVAFQI